MMRPDKPNSRVRARLLYRTPDNQPYDVALLRVDLRDMDPSLRPVRLSRAPILKGKHASISISLYFIERHLIGRSALIIPAAPSCDHFERQVEHIEAYSRGFLVIGGN